MIHSSMWTRWMRCFVKSMKPSRTPDLNPELIHSALKFLFAWRYFKAKKSTNAINIISWVSVCAIILGTASLIVVMSVFNGLEQLVRSLYSSFYTDVRISPASGKIMRVPVARLTKLSQTPGVVGYALTIEDQAL